MRVNLIRKSEIRYQGAVSRRFLITTVITTTLLILLLFSVILCMGWQARKMKVKRLLAQMDEISPKVTRVEALQTVSTHNSKTCDALRKWMEMRLTWHDALRDIQLQIPESIQLNMLEMGVSDGNGADWSCRMDLRGTAVSAQPEDVVVRFRRSLLEVGSLKGNFSSIKLVSFNRRDREQTEKKDNGREQATFSIMSTGMVTRPVAKTP